MWLTKKYTQYTSFKTCIYLSAQVTKNLKQMEYHMRKRDKSHPEDGVYYCQETQRAFEKGELFFYFYRFDGSIKSGNIGEMNYKVDGGLFAVRKTIEEAENDKLLIETNKTLTTNTAMITNKKIGNTVKYLRLIAGFASRLHFIRECNLDAKAYVKIELGVKLDRLTLHKVLQAHEITIEQFFSIVREVSNDK